MKSTFYTFLLCLIIISCDSPKEFSSINPNNWKKRTVSNPLPDSLLSGTTYLSVYSQIYSQTEHLTHSLTATVSLRNANRNDTVFITHADYFDTKGNLIRSYFEKTIFIAPMETVEIIIDEVDNTGGTGANFLFDWKIYPNSNEPLFEGVMLSTSGQQGLSFTTHGKNINS